MIIANSNAYFNWNQKDELNCYNKSLFGIASPLVTLESIEEYNMSKSMCLASRIFIGDYPNKEVISNKLLHCNQHHQNLLVYVLGGSVTCGRNVDISRPDRLCNHQYNISYECKEESYPALLEKALNRLYPCINKPHVVRNVCKSGCGSDYHVESMGLYMKEQSNQSIKYADLIIIETTTNDVHELISNSIKKQKIIIKPVHFYTEVLLRQLLQLTQQPSLLYLHAAWRDFTKPPNYHRDSSYIQRTILKYICYLTYII